MPLHRSYSTSYLTSIRAAGQSLDPVAGHDHVSLDAGHPNQRVKKTVNFHHSAIAGQESRNSDAAPQQVGCPLSDRADYEALRPWLRYSPKRHLPFFTRIATLILPSSHAFGPYGHMLAQTQHAHATQRPDSGPCELNGHQDEHHLHGHQNLRFRFRHWKRSMTARKLIPAPTFYRMHLLYITFMSFLCGSVVYALEREQLGLFDALFLGFSSTCQAGLTPFDLSLFRAGTRYFMAAVIFLTWPVPLTLAPVFIRRYYFARRLKEVGVKSKEAAKCVSEYAALRVLVQLVTMYVVVLVLLTFAALYIYVAVSSKAQAIIEASGNGQSTFAWSFFHTFTALANNGLSSFGTNLIPWNGTPYILIVMVFATMLGNVAFPIALRLIVWICYRVSKRLDALSGEDSSASGSSGASSDSDPRRSEVRTPTPPAHPDPAPPSNSAFAPTMPPADSARASGHMRHQSFVVRPCPCVCHVAANHNDSSYLTKQCCYLWQRGQMELARRGSTAASASALQGCTGVDAPRVDQGQAFPLADTAATAATAESTPAVSPIPATAPPPPLLSTSRSTDISTSPSAITTAEGTLAASPSLMASRKRAANLQAYVCRFLAEHDLIKSSDVYAFLLHQPRRCFTHLFRKPQTKWLLFVLVVLNTLNFLSFLVLDWNNAAFDGFDTGQKVYNSFFQAFVTRTTGFASMDLSLFSAGTLIVLLAMMYISSTPVAVAIRHTDRSTAAQLPASEIDVSGIPIVLEGRSVRLQTKRIFTQDVFLLFASLFVICVIESSKFKTFPEFTIFRVIFEVISGYGGIGLSLGFPGTVNSFSSIWRTGSKCVLMFVMLLGRHRGLPNSVDHAIQLAGLPMHQ